MDAMGRGQILIAHEIDIGERRADFSLGAIYKGTRIEVCRVKNEIEKGLRKLRGCGLGVNRTN